MADPRPAFSQDIEDAPGTLEWLQAWYALQCDGDWEHGYGLEITTLDNPGWSIKIDLTGTSVEKTAFESTELHRGEHDWVVARRQGTTFTAACGPLNLGESLHTFRAWVTASEVGPS